MSGEPALTLTTHVTRVVAGFRAVLAARMAKADAIRPILLLLWSRLGHLERRIATLAARFEKGLLVAPRARPPATQPDAPPRARRTAQPGLRLPNKPAWLIAHAIETVVYGEYIRQLLARPDMAALLEAAPRLKSEIRVVARLLMPDLPDILALPPRPARAKQVKLKPPKPERPRKPRRPKWRGAHRPKEFWRPGPIRPLWTA
jgi:hypothetical protein